MTKYITPKPLKIRTDGFILSPSFVETGIGYNGAGAGNYWDPTGYSTGWSQDSSNDFGMWWYSNYSGSGGTYGRSLTHYVAGALSGAPDSTTPSIKMTRSTTPTDHDPTGGNYCGSWWAGTTDPVPNEWWVADFWIKTNGNIQTGAGIGFNILYSDWAAAAQYSEGISVATLNTYTDWTHVILKAQVSATVDVAKVLRPLVSWNYDTEHNQIQEMWINSFKVYRDYWISDEDMKMTAGNGKVLVQGEFVEEY